LTFHATRQPSDGRVAFCDRARCGEGGEGSAAFPGAFTSCATLPVVGELSSVAQFAVVRDGANGEEVWGCLIWPTFPGASTFYVPLAPRDGGAFAVCCDVVEGGYARLDAPLPVCGRWPTAEQL